MSQNIILVEVGNALKSLAATEISANTFESRAPTVYDGYPASITAWDAVCLGDIHEGSLGIPVMAGGAGQRQRREAEWFQAMRLSVARSGPDADVARRAALAVFKEMDDLIAKYPALNLEASYPTLRCYISQFRTNTVADDAARGWRVAVDFHVHCKARHS